MFKYIIDRIMNVKLPLDILTIVNLRDSQPKQKKYRGGKHRSRRHVRY